MYNLYMKQKVFKIRDKYDIYDQQQNPIYHIDQDFKLIGNTINVIKYDGSKSFVIDRRLLTLLPKYDVNFHDGKSFSIFQKLTFLKKRIEVVSDYYNLDLQGSFWDLDFEVYNNGIKVGHISKEFLTWADTFSITVIDPEFEEELVALMIVVDDIQDMQQSN